MASIHSIWQHASRTVLECLFPPRCIGCEVLLESGQRLACERCAPTIEPLESPRCPRCAHPRPRAPGFESMGVDEACRHCRDTPPVQDATHARWLYRGVIAEALQHAKYGGELWRLRALADAMTPWLTRYLRRHDGPSSPSSVGWVPVPMHTADLRERGFNVPALLLRFALEPTDHAIQWGTVEKIDQTPPQAGLSRGERLTNVQGAFALCGHLPTEPDRWIVFDDIVTTGATASEVSSVLREGGASSIEVLSVARAVWR